MKTALQLYNDGLARYPDGPDLLTFRGIARAQAEPEPALGDFSKAVAAGAASMWPYYFLAWDAFERRDYLRAWQLCLQAIGRPGGSERELAQLHELLGIALA